MIKSIYTRFAAFMFLFALILVPAMLFLSSYNFQTANAAPKPIASELGSAALDIETQDPVIHAASLSLIDDIEIPADAETKDLLIRANDLVRTQQFDHAIRTLGAVNDQDKDSYEVQFLLARLLSWSGQHLEAEEKFEALNETYPHNADILVSHAYLKLYQNERGQAVDLFEAVLKKHPEYQDAKNGLKMAQSVKG